MVRAAADHVIDTAERTDCVWESGPDDMGGFFNTKKPLDVTFFSTLTSSAVQCWGYGRCSINTQGFSLSNSRTSH